MLNFICGACPAVQFCGQEEQVYTTAGTQADEQAATFEAQEVAMRLAVVEADHAVETGEMSEVRRSAVEHFAGEVAANSERPEVNSTPLRAELWRQQAQRAQANTTTIKAGCNGLPKVLANLGHLVGIRTCASTAPEAPVKVAKQNAGLRPIV